MTVSDQLNQSLAEVWEHHLEALRNALAKAQEGLQDVLRLDEYQRQGHDKPHLQESLGPFGSQSLDLSALSEILDKSSSYRRLPEGRVERIRSLIKRLHASREALSEAPAQPPGANLDEPEEDIHEKAEAHLSGMAGIFRDLRIAPLEIRGKGAPPLEGEAFEAFSWRDLDSAELRLCPPFVVHARLEPDSGDALRKIMALLGSGKPLKIVVLRSSLLKSYPPGAASGIPAALALEMVPLAMRGVSFLQSCGVADEFGGRLSGALASPRPTLVSLLAEKPGEEEAAYATRAQDAVRSRAFPLVSYDPDHGSGFVSCLDLSANPPPDPSFTFAEFAATQEDFASGFQDVPEGAGPAELVPIGEFLGLSPHQRADKLPCLHHTGENGGDEVRVLTPGLVAQISEQEHLWKTLQEIAGEDHPGITATRKVLKAEFGAEQEALRNRLTAEMTTGGDRRDHLAIANAVRTLSARLMGVDPSVIDLERLVQAAASASSPSAPAPAESETN